MDNTNLEELAAASILIRDAYSAIDAGSRTELYRAAADMAEAARRAGDALASWPDEAEDVDTAAATLVMHLDEDASIMAIEDAAGALRVAGEALAELIKAAYITPARDAASSITDYVAWELGHDDPEGGEA